MVVNTRMMVVLPAPFGPSRPNTVPCSTRQVDTVHRDDVAETLDQPIDFYDRIHEGALYGRASMVSSTIDRHSSR